MVIKVKARGDLDLAAQKGEGDYFFDLGLFFENAGAFMSSGTCGENIINE